MEYATKRVVFKKGDKMIKMKQIENSLPEIISYFENDEYKEMVRKVIETSDKNFYVIYEMEQMLPGYGETYWQRRRRIEEKRKVKKK